MHYFKPYNRQLVIKALKKAGREDLIGWGGDCLIPPYEKHRQDKAPAGRKQTGAADKPSRHAGKAPDRGKGQSPKKGKKHGH